MAIIWQKNIKGTHYEVRKAGNSTRLYTDGVFHSQFNPNKPVTGSVWDLLMLPAFFKSRGSIRRVLVLGVGGGSVLRLLRRYVEPEEIVGVELNPVHLTIARKYFGIGKNIASLHEADAVQWMENYQGPPFDMIIDDLFGEEEGEGVRAVALNSRWLRLLNKHLNPEGLLVVNMLSTRSIKESAYFTHSSIARQFKGVFTLTLPQLHNVVAAFLKTESSATQLRQKLKDIPGLNNLKGRNYLPFRVRKLS